MYALFLLNHVLFLLPFFLQLNVFLKAYFISHINLIGCFFTGEPEVGQNCGVILRAGVLDFKKEVVNILQYSPVQENKLVSHIS
jgi:hypothetical protein